MPAQLDAQTVDAQHLILEFWTGTFHMGYCELPIQSIVEAAAKLVRICFLFWLWIWLCHSCSGLSAWHLQSAQLLHARRSHEWVLM